MPSLSFSLLAVYAQKVFGVETDSVSAVAKWATSLLKMYECAYHFGESEAESDFMLVVSEGTVSA